MRTITVTGNETIQIGRRGENQATQIIWTNILENWRTMYGNGVVQLSVRRPNDTDPYPAACEVIGNDIMWTIQAADTAQNGAGECELSYIVDAVLVKSQTWDTMIARSLTGDGTVDPPSEPSKTWFSKIQSEIGNLEDLGTGDKSNLVAAINEAAQSGGGGGSTVELDTTLTQSGKAADAKAVGDALAGKQDTISDLEAIRTGAAKGATALQSVPNTYRTAAEQDVVDSGKVDKVTGKGLSTNDYTDAAKAKVDALAPVATSGSYDELTSKPTIPTALPNPNALTFTGAVTGSYDGSAAMTVNIPSAVTDAHINSLIDAKLGVIENGSY